MSLAADDLGTGPAASPGSLAFWLEKWGAVPWSRLDEHEGSCCLAARSWLRAMDESMRDHRSLEVGPGWLGRRFRWGPSPWPLAWCKAIRAETLDCGALSCMAREIFRHRGREACLAGVVQRYGEDTTARWTEHWTQAETPSSWAGRGCVYHEVCAVVGAAGELRLWDPSAGGWLEPSPGGHGSIAALRLVDPEREFIDRSLAWAGNALAAGRWIEVRPRPAGPGAG